MKTNKLKSFVSFLGFLGIIGVIITLTTNSTKTYRPVSEMQSEWKNLKILPQDITKDSLMFVMHTFNNSLGVDCSHCHTPKKDNPDKMDFPSDANKNKEIARGMLKMTNDINANYFLPHAPDPKPKQITSVYCITCHRGNPNPEKYLQGVSKMIPVLMPIKKEDMKMK
ncbi:c-type cytochrome [Kaistella flava (ex Peng et al. 2021)]|uniref:Photosynthetic reaction center cytochrome c subunit n=1 Tax=Kaistella flava (ex Peng et al. 2021) TaxID=2038776 RepID=A0A7M2Y821_9FLAO|nr:c-type cytochrome [Kaistella flava (ex Peng et al. 2021)]QOW09765.1 c-type cytochrome [Kaistella flava (ex Peng et al. 2021)]